jgi:hypothetical protein
MDRQRIDQKKAEGMLVSGGIVLVLHTGVLLEGTYVRRLMENAFRGSANIALDALTVAW